MGRPPRNGKVREASESEVLRKKRMGRAGWARGMPFAQEILDKQAVRFRQRFGRDPGPKDPVFFDESKDEPTMVSPEFIAEQEKLVRVALLEALAKVGTPPRIRYAYAKTGLIVTRDTLRLLDADDRRSWSAAIDEWDRMSPQEQAMALQPAGEGRQQ